MCRLIEFKFQNGSRPHLPAQLSPWLFSCHLKSFALGHAIHTEECVDTQWVEIQVFCCNSLPSSMIYCPHQLSVSL